MAHGQGGAVAGATGETIDKYTIVMWYGTLASIPAGWQICDGTGGTPDLRNYFVRGAPAGQQGSNAVQGHNAHGHDNLTGLKTGSSIALTGTTVVVTTSHQHTIADDANIPEYKQLVFIMKL